MILSPVDRSRPSRLPSALDALQRDESAVLSDLERLIAADTSFPPGSGYEAFAALVEDLTRPLGYVSQRISVPRDLWNPGDGTAHGERVNVLASRRTEKPVCSLYFHVDAVPPGDGWTRPPLRLSVERRTLYGRGTADMKGPSRQHSLPCGPQIVWRDLRFAPTLLFCTDEEGGLYPGARYLAEQNLDQRPSAELQRRGRAADLGGLLRQHRLSCPCERTWRPFRRSRQRHQRARRVSCPCSMPSRRSRRRSKPARLHDAAPAAFQWVALTARLNIAAAHGGRRAPCCRRRSIARQSPLCA